MGWDTFALVSSVEPGREKVICFVDDSNQLVLDTDREALLTFMTGNKVILKEVDMNMQNAFEEGDTFIVVRQDDKTRSESLARAYNLVHRSKKWNFLKFNSEHFVTYALTGVPESNQLTNLLTYLKKNMLIACWDATFMRKLGIDCDRKVNLNMVLKLIQYTLVGKKALSGKAGTMFGSYMGALIEGGFFLYNLKTAYDQWNSDEISKEQFGRQVAHSVGAFGGSLLGRMAGAALGTAILPGWGTFAGNVVGGMVGGYIGSRVGVITYETFFW